MQPDNPLRPTVTLWVLLGAFVLLMASIVVGGLRRPTMPTGAVTTPQPVVVADTLVGPASYTVNALDQADWTFFDFSRNAVVTQPGPLDWDLAFRRFHIVANGGPGFAGNGAVSDLGRMSLDSLRQLPDSGWTPSSRDSTNAAIRRWYDYGYASHLLEPRGHVYGVRTADGRYAAIEIASYYCQGAESGCLTFRYVYQGDGSRSFERRATAAGRTP